eukprot:COSAG02_NODE_5042_length_4700_cov_4.582790_4_plen_154_part_00
MTLVEGIAGGTVDRANTGPREPDGFNIWPALISGGASPRTEVVHQVSNQYYDALNGTSFINGSAVSSGNGDGCLSMAIRMDNWKLIVGNPGDHRFVKWPDPDSVPHAFGSSGGGEREPGTEHCVSSTLSRRRISSPPPVRVAGALVCRFLLGL